MNIEILIPVRNPTEVFSQTIDSLTAQTDKNFSVLISDNFSTQGAGQIEGALAKLSAAGIPARKTRPPAELGRVEHWNWLHHQSQAEWHKPLFAGDWLEPDYISTIFKTAQAAPACGFIYCGFQLHRDGKIETVISHWSGRFFTAREMQDVVLRYAMQFGPPSAAAYKRDHFLKSGGYDPSLPICADSLFFCRLAARHGAFGVPEAKVHFCIHAARFSDQLPSKRRETFREQMRYLWALGRTAHREGWSFPVFGYTRLFAREIFCYFKLR